MYIESYGADGDIGDTVTLYKICSLKCTMDICIMLLEE